MSDRVFFAQDMVGQQFCFTIADQSYEPTFRKHVTQWARLNHDPKKKSPVGKVRVMIMTREEYANYN